MKLVTVVATLTLALFIAMASFSSPLQPGIPELQFTFSKAAFNNIVAAWPADGVARFKAHFFFDFPFLICYGTLGYLLVTRTDLFTRVAPPTKARLALSLPCAAGADTLENLLHLYLVTAKITTPAWLYAVAGGIASVKWLISALFALTVAFAMARYLWSRLRQ